ncbi:MAG: hypothetical protein ACXV8J_06540 [Methylobacter sp.]
MNSGKILIVKIGGEGGGASVYARQLGDALVFWHEGCSWDVDNDFWSDYHSQPVTDLENALPSWWMNAHPAEIHPLFIPWFREHYQSSQSRSKDTGDGACCFERNHWLEILEPKNCKDIGYLLGK